MHPFQRRVVEEKQELDTRIEKLAAFAQNDLFKALDPQEQARLHLQYYLMKGLSAVLGERIEAFVEEDPM